MSNPPKLCMRMLKIIMSRELTSSELKVELDKFFKKIYANNSGIYFKYISENLDLLKYKDIFMEYKLDLNIEDLIKNKTFPSFYKMNEDLFDIDNYSDEIIESIFCIESF